MKSLLRSLVFLLGFAAISSPSFSAETVIIDTDFSLVSKDGLAVVTKPVDNTELPMKAPTSFQATPPSTITAGTAAIEDLRPPYALLKLASTEAEPEIPAPVALHWNLRELGMDAGKYRLTYKILTFASAAGGGLVRVNLSDENGRPPSIHPTGLPMKVFFTKNRLQATYDSPGQPSADNQLFSVEMIFDLDKKTWSASADGMPLVETTPFPEEVAELQAPRIQGVEIAGGGYKNFVEESGWAVANLKLVKLE